MPTSCKVAIVYLSYHSNDYLSDLVSSLKKMTYPKQNVELIIVDNPHPTHGSSVAAIQNIVMPLSGTELPHVTLLAQNTNIGFSAGCNAGIRYAVEHGFDYIFLHNDDGFTESNCIERLVSVMEADTTIGATQALMLLYPETQLINSSGNSLQYLGIGFCNNFRVPVENVVLPPVANTNYASGAAVIMRASLVKQLGLWDEDYFLYHEDIEYSVRLRLAGYRVVVASLALFYHKYNFSRNQQKFFYIERNRLGLLLSMYRLPTLVLLFPLAIVWELGMLVFAVQQGWLTQKVATYVYWLKPTTWRVWLAKRARLQKVRVITDAKLLGCMVDTVSFVEKSINTPLVRYVANPLLTAYGFVLRLIVFW